MIPSTLSEFENDFTALIRNGTCDELTQFLERHPSACQTKWKGSQPWIDVAIAYHRSDIVACLLSSGFDPNQDCGPPAYTTSFDTALSAESIEIVALMLEYGADVANPSIHTRYPIAATTRSRDSLEAIKLLEKYGADLDKDYMHNGFKKMVNALSMAEIFGKQDVVDYLRGKGFKTPEEKAASASVEHGNQESVEELQHEVFDYFKKIIGIPEPLSIIQIIPTGIPVSIHVIPSAPNRPYVTLFTTGLSDHPMNVPEGQDDWAFAEIYIQLPADWKYKDYADPNWGWPQHWLRSMAQYPSQQNTWLGGPVTLVANQDPPQPLAPNTTYSTLLLLVDRNFTRRDGHTIQLYRMLPLYTEERNLELREGIAYLMNALDRHNIPFVVDMHRKNVALAP